MSRSLLSRTPQVLTRNRLALSIGMLMGLGAPGLAAAACVPADATTVVCSGPAPVLVGNAYTNNADNQNVTVAPGGQVANFLGIGVPMTLGGNNVTLTNNGTIDPSLLGLISVLSKGAVVGNGAATNVTITNNGTLNGVAPLLSVGLGALDGVALDARVGAGGRATIVNTGTIGTQPIVGLAVLAPDANVLTVSGGGQADIVNDTTGTIIGRVGLYSAPTTSGNTFVNRGTLIGSVGMGGGNDTFIADTSSSVSAGGGILLGAQVGDLLGVGVLDFAAAGVIDGGAGTDSLGLVGLGESTASAATYQNFEVLNVNSGRWHIQGLLGSQGTVLSGGTAVISNGADLGPQVVADGGSLEAELNPVTVTAPVTLQPGGLTVQGDAQPLTLSGSVSGPGVLTKNGAAELDLTGANTYTGGTILNDGTLGVAGASALGVGDLNVNGGLLTALPGDASLANAVHLNANLEVDGPNNLTLSGVLDGAGALNKDGSGILTVSGANAYTGGTNLNDGTIRVAGSSGLGTGDVFANGGILDAVDPTASLANTIHTDGADLVVGGTNDLTLNGPITGLNGLVKDGFATLTLNGPASYLGSTVLNAGAIKLGNANALGPGLFEAAGTGVSLLADAPITLGQDVLLDAGADLTLSSPNTTLNGTVSGPGSLIVAPGKVATLNGANGYTGATILQDQATLNVGNDAALGAGILVAAGGTGQTLHADVDQTLANPVFLGGPLTTTEDGTLALTGPIAGPGSLIQAGPGILELDGANAYDGGTTVTGGTLRVGNDAALGTGALTLNAGTTLTNDVPVTLANPIQVAGDAQVVTNADLTATGSLSGAGNLTKDGAGVLTLGGDLSAYAGQLVAVGGTLTVVQPFAGNLGVGAGATVNLGDGGNAPVITAPIEGTLNLGNGTNTLNIPVDQFGQLTGTVNGGAGVDTLNVVNAGDGTWAPGVLTGLDQIAIRAGANVLLADGINRPADAPATLVEGGLALNGSLGSVVTVAPGGTLVGHGTIDGNLIVNGTLAPGGIDGLTGVLAPVGPVPQALAVTNATTINAGSQFIVRTQPDGASDHLDVAGPVTINGGNVTVHPLNATDGYGLSTAYNIVNAAGGLTGNFSSVTQADLPFLMASLSADPTHAILTLSRDAGGGDPGNPGGGDNGGGNGGNPGGGDNGGGNGGNPGGGDNGGGNGGNPGGGDNGGGNGGNPDGGNNGGDNGTPGGGNGGPDSGPSGPGGSMGYGQFPGLSRNQRNMANSLQAVENREVAMGQVSGIEPLLRRVRGLSADQVKPVFDSLTGESYVSAAQQAAASARHNSQSILAAGASPGGVDSTPGYRLSGAWVTLLGNNRTAGGTQGVADQHVQQRGIAAGVDGQFDNGLALGPYIATDKTTFDPSRRYDDGKIRQTTVGVRLQQNLEPVWWRVMLGYGWTHLDMNRGILLPGYTASRAHGEADGHVFQAAGELGWTFRSGGWDWAPVVGVYHTRATFEHVNERNANEANLSLRGLDYHETVASVGVQGGYNWTTTSDGAWRVEGSIKGFHNFNADPTRARAAFSADPSSSYSLVGASPSKQWVELGGGVRYTFADRWSLSAGYGVALGGREKAHGVNLGVSMTW